MKKIIAFFLILLPMRLKLFFYRKLFGYDLDRTARIGFSFIMPKSLSMQKNSKIGHMNVIKGLTKISMGESSSIGNLNWVSGFSEDIKSEHFSDQVSRSPELIIGDHSAITNRHLIDCTDKVSIGRFSTFAGFRSQILTHSISISDARQRSGAVSIGDYAFIGTASVILPNSALPNFSVLGAGSVLNKKFTEEYQLYAGTPARPVKKLDSRAIYFNRKTGFVI